MHIIVRLNNAPKRECMNGHEPEQDNNKKCELGSKM